MKWIVKKKDPPWGRTMNKPMQPIKPSDVYPNGIRPRGARQPLAEYSYLGWYISGLNGYCGRH